MKRQEINNLKSVANHYMTYVGPPRKYELIGKMQFDFQISKIHSKD